VGTITQKFGVLDANTNCPPDVVIFKISSTRFLALQCSKMLTDPTKSPLQAENSTFFWRGHG